MATRIYLALGSNVGDRLENLRKAVAQFESIGLAVQRTSSVYETEPVDRLDQPWFLNCVVEATTTVLPRVLMQKILRLETQMGRNRQRESPKGPRTIDIDIVLYGKSRIHSPDLTVPHPRFRQRRFVLVALNELDPKLRDPESQRSVHELLEAITDRSQVTRTKEQIVASPKSSVGA
jgi:2-amino-4-hydroxy-6-hydroxymethyldihydropteridine diphosphokinase